jgi:preprotein translocase subunit SecD
MPRRRYLTIVLSIVGATVLAMGAIVYRTARPNGVAQVTIMTLAATALDGGTADVATMDATVQALRARLRAIDLSGSLVRVYRDWLTVQVPGRPDPYVLRALAEPGEVRIRRVLASTFDDTPDTPASEGATAIGGGAGGGTGGAVGVGPRRGRDQLVAKLGAAYTAVTSEAVSRTAPWVLDATTQALLRPFATLRPDEVAQLPAAVQYLVPTIRCGQLNRRQPGVLSAPGEQVVVCLGNIKYRLDVATVDDGDIEAASARAGTFATWTLEVSFTASGQRRWTQLSREAAADPTANQVAVLVDGELAILPEVPTVETGDLVFSGTWRASGALALAAKLTAGALPVRLTVMSIT